jgi:CheY-like chemotaxis protein
MAQIIVVEDELEIRENLVELLEVAGHQVRTAKNGKEGYEMIENHSPEMVICDVNMPVMNGYELLGALTQSMDLADIPAFLFLSARIESEDITHGLRLGADDYILKPFDHIQLLKAINLRLAKKNLDLRAIASNFDGFRKLALPCDDGLDIVGFEEIVMCQAERAYCSVYKNDGKRVLVSKPMKYFEPALIAQGFIKVHKSTIVNPMHILKYVRGKGGYLVMTSGVKADVAASKKAHIESMLRGE